jgi:hypothetical protein
MPVIKLVAEQVRKPNTSWQSTDQPPVYPGCEDRESTTDQWDCFQASTSRAVGVYFTDNPFPLNPNAPKAVVLHVAVDQRGKVQFKGMEPDNDHAIREAMQMAIEKLPNNEPCDQNQPWGNCPSAVSYSHPTTKLI